MNNHYGTTSDADVTPTSKVLSIDGEGSSVTIPTCKRALDVDSQDSPASRVRVSPPSVKGGPSDGSSNKYPIFVSDSEVSAFIPFDKKPSAPSPTQDADVVPDSQAEPAVPAVVNIMEPNSGVSGPFVSGVEDVVDVKRVDSDLVPKKAVSPK